MIVALAVLLAIWQLPKAFRQSEAYENASSTKELNAYLALKDKPIDQTDSLEIANFLGTVVGMSEDLAEANYGRCQLNADKAKVQPRIMTKALLDGLTREAPMSKEEYFEKISSLNSSNPFERLNLTNGDGFANDLMRKNYHKGLLRYVHNLKNDRIVFIAEIEKVVAPVYRGERQFIEGNCRVGIWAADLEAKKVLCKSAIEVQSDNSSGLVLKSPSMNQKLYLELIEKAVSEVEKYCKAWLSE